MFASNLVTTRHLIAVTTSLLVALSSGGSVVAQDPDSGSSSQVAGAVTLGPWQVAALEDAEAGLVMRGVAAGELGTIALGDLESGGRPEPAAWMSADGTSWQRATFADDASAGIMEAAVATPDGWIAVGRDFPERARVWRSDDGLAWVGVSDIESAEGHVMYDVAATPHGLIAVGCEAALHCTAGTAWRSDDGSAWSLLSQIPMQTPRAVRSLGATVVVAGSSDLADQDGSQAVSVSSPDGIEWTVGSAEVAAPSGFMQLAGLGDEVLMVGVEQGEDQAGGQVRLHVSGDGSAWAPIQAPEQTGWPAAGIATMGDLVVLAGTRQGADHAEPAIYSSGDRSAWDEGTFADGLQEAEYDTVDIAFTADGSRAILVGAAGAAPAIWYAEVVPDTAAPDAVAATGVPKRFELATVPEAGFGISVQDIISGGPGYIAVGGGSNTGLDMKALVWVSEDGRTWRAAKLKGGAVDGLIEGVARIPGGGYVAVGRDFAPAGRPAGAPANGLVWHSKDGLAWTRVKPHKSFTGSVMYGVATTPSGVVAVGCKAGFHCLVGRVWTSRDGRKWKLTQTLPMAPFTVSANGDAVVAGGTDDAVDLGGGRATIAIADGTAWGMTDPLAGRRSQVDASSAYGEGFLVAGWRAPPGNGATRSALYVSKDGEDWRPVTSKAFKGLTATALGTAGDLVVVAGTSFDPQTDTTPLAFWSRDLGAFSRVEFATDLQRDGLAILTGEISRDGTLAFVAGANGYRPAIWFSEIE